MWAFIIVPTYVCYWCQFDCENSIVWIAFVQNIISFAAVWHESRLLDCFIYQTSFSVTDIDKYTNND